MLFIFDMGGVVTSTFAFDGICKILNITKQDFLTVCKTPINNQNTDIWYDYQTGKLTTNEFWESFNRHITQLNTTNIKETSGFTKDFIPQNVKTVTQDLFRLTFHPEEKSETIKLIQKLKKHNRVVCGTNTIQSHWESHMERGDYQYFHQTYASNKINCLKPDADFFTTIMKAENYTPEQTFFVDDKEENCQAAKNLGINTEIFTTPHNLYNAWKKYI